MHEVKYYKNFHLTVQKNWYNGDGKRIKKEENNETVVYIYMGIQVIYEKVVESGKETKYIDSIAAKLFASLAQDCCLALLATPQPWLYVPCVLGFMMI